MTSLWMLSLVGFVVCHVVTASKESEMTYAVVFLDVKSMPGPQYNMSYLMITAQQDNVSVKVSMYNSPDKKYMLSNGEFRNISVGPAYRTKKVIERKGILITTTGDVIVHGVNIYWSSGDAFLSLPVTAKDTHFVIPCSNDAGSSEYAVVAVADKTHVQVERLDEDTEEYTQIFSKTISRLETFLVDDDCYGDRVITDKPVAVFSGDLCAQEKGYTCEHTELSVRAISSYGKVHYVPPIGGRDRKDGYLVRVYPPPTGTHMKTSTGENEALLAGSYSELDVKIDDTLLEINCSSTCMVVQFNKGNIDKADTGPFAVNILPLKLYVNTMSWRTVIDPTNETDVYYLGIVVPTGKEPGVILDKESLASLHWERFPSQSYSYGVTEVGNGSHTLSHADPSVKLAGYLHAHFKSPDVAFGHAVWAGAVPDEITTTVLPGQQVTKAETTFSHEINVSNSQPTTEFWDREIIRTQTSSERPATTVRLVKTKTTDHTTGPVSSTYTTKHVTTKVSTFPYTYTTHASTVQSTESPFHTSTIPRTLEETISQTFPVHMDLTVGGRLGSEILTTIQPSRPTTLPQTTVPSPFLPAYSSTIWGNYAGSLAADGDTGTCHVTGLETRSWLVIDFQSGRDIRAVYIKGQYDGTLTVRVGKEIHRVGHTAPSASISDHCGSVAFSPSEKIPRKKVNCINPVYGSVVIVLGETDRYSHMKICDIYPV